MINPTVLTAVIVVFVCIIIMLLCLLFILKGHSAGKSRSKKRGKRHIVKKSHSQRIPGRQASEAGSKERKAASTDRSPDDSIRAEGSKLPPLRAQADDDMQKYAEITKSFLRSKYNAEIKVVGLKRYYSERHGFDCIDFSYRLDSGMTPAEFRQAMNHLDAALSNVSGVDTLTFAAGSSADGLYRTTFYLGK